MNSTIVVFRKFKDDKSIVALFPMELNYHDGYCESYQHVGQHGAADYKHCIAISTPAKPKEYAALYRELLSIGYTLEVRSKIIRGAQ